MSGERNNVIHMGVNSGPLPPSSRDTRPTLPAYLRGGSLEPVDPGELYALRLACQEAARAAGKACKAMGRRGYGAVPQATADRVRKALLGALERISKLTGGQGAAP